MTIALVVYLVGIPVVFGAVLGWIDGGRALAGKPPLLTGLGIFLGTRWRERG